MWVTPRKIGTGSRAENPGRVARLKVSAGRRPQNCGQVVRHGLDADAGGVFGWWLNELDLRKQTFG